MGKSGKKKRHKHKNGYHHHNRREGSMNKTSPQHATHLNHNSPDKIGFYRSPENVGKAKEDGKTSSKKRSIKFLHPKSPSAAFGVSRLADLRKPPGSAFSFDDYRSCGKKSLINKGERLNESGQSSLKLDGDRSNNSHGNDSATKASKSVNEVLADRVGCRPRLNSTDGELNLPSRGLCDEMNVLRSHVWSNSMIESNSLSMPGLNNLGNTCFMNATLQCLIYLPTFSQCTIDSTLSLTRAAKGGKFATGQRLFLDLRNLIKHLHGNTTKSFSPRSIANALSSLGCDGRKSRFRLGRQEDAHEFLVHLLDSMKEGELRAAGIDSRKSGWRDRLPIPRLDETTLIHRIFGGYLRSQLLCPSCGYSSNTYDPFFDLDLEISKANVCSVSDAVNEFTRPEKLDSMNRWRCSSCKNYVCPKKQLTVFRPPLSLCIQLKRFTFSGVNYGGKWSSGGGGKINKRIEFPTSLKLPLSDRRTCRYMLHGVVSHIGSSSSSGHYTAFVKKPTQSDKKKWYHMDDSHAQEVSEKTVVQNRHAYVLFYTRHEVKIEYPKPPSGGMTSSDAVKVVAARARARADSIASASSIELAGKKSKSGSESDEEKQHRRKNRLQLSSHVTKKDAPSKRMETSPVKKIHSNEGDAVSRKTAGTFNKPTPLKDLKKESDLRSIDNSFDVSIQLKELKNRMIRDSESSPDQKNRITNNDSNTESKKKRYNEATAVVLKGVQEGNIEVFSKRHKNVWKPIDKGARGTNLLGSKAVAAWNDDEESISKSAITKDSIERKREALVGEINLNERKRKRKLYLDRWNAKLDEGKKKKVKSRKRSQGILATKPSQNPFHRIQSSMQNMTASWREAKKVKYKKKSRRSI